MANDRPCAYRLHAGRILALASLIQIEMVAILLCLAMEGIDDRVACRLRRRTTRWRLGSERTPLLGWEKLGDSYDFTRASAGLGRAKGDQSTICLSA